MLVIHVRQIDLLKLAKPQAGILLVSEPVIESLFGFPFFPHL